MALTFADVTTASSTSSTATLAITAVTAAVADMLILAVAADNAGTAGIASLSTTVTDSAGNTWTNRGGLINRTPGAAANDGTTLGLWTCDVTTALSSGTVTVNFSPNTTSKAAALKKATPPAGGVVEYVSAGSGGTGGAATWNSGAVSVTDGYTILAASAVEDSAVPNADADTTNGSWSTVQTALASVGGASNSQAVAFQYKTVNATGNQTYDSGTNGGGSRDYCWNWLQIRQADAGTGSAAGAGDATAEGGSTAGAAGAAAGIGAGAGVGAALSGAVGAAAAAGAAAGIGAALSGMVGSAAGHGVVVGVAGADVPTTGNTWPQELPYPTIEGYSVKPGLSVSRTAMEFGAARARRRTTRPLCDVDVGWTFTLAQFEIFEDWMREEGEEGGAWFDIILLFPRGLAAVTARVKGEIQSQPLAPNVVRVTTTLEVLQRPVIAAAALAIILDDEGDEPSWPADASVLPLPVWDDYRLTDHPALMRSPDDLRGLPQQVRRSLSTITEIQLRFELSAGQAATFDGFYKHRAGEGTRWFSMPVFDGQGLHDVQTRFMGGASWTAIGGGRWSVTASVELRERRSPRPPVADVGLIGAGIIGGVLIGG